MKILNRNNVLLTLLMLALISFTACVEDDDFDTPSSVIIEPTFDPSTTIFTTINAVAGQLAQEQGNTTLNYSDENTTYTYSFNPNDEILEAYVVSSDEGGNFFEEIIVQDNFENPTTGIKVLIDVNPLFVRYDVGRKLYIKLNGLTVGISNGVLTLGQANGNEVDKISPADELSIIQRSAEKQDLVPLPLLISNFTEDKTNLFVQVQDVQFNRNQAGQLSYAAEASDEFDGERILESCSESTAVVFSTSTFADFKGATLPLGRGNVNGILTRNFEGDTFNLVVNTLEGVQLTGTDRCDPILLECGLAMNAGANTLFSEDFETQTTFTPVSGNGWTNFIEAGTEAWEAYTQGGTNSSQGVSARAGSFQSGDDSSIAWLITPAIDLDANPDVSIEFETSNSFSDGSTMDVLFSNDWDGTEAGITSATWGLLADAYVTQDSDFFGAWFSSGIVDLSCETGQIYIAFKYTGSGQSAFDGTYELDNIRISSN